MLYRVMLAIGGKASAVVGGPVFVIVFMCGGDLNFIAPYSHELSHGLALSTAYIVCFLRYVASRGWKQRGTGLASAGVFLGRTFLTKTEVFLALSGAIITGTLVEAWVKQRRGTDTCAALAVLTTAALVSIAPAVLLFSRPMTLSSAVEAVTSSWHPLLESAIRERLRALDFYRRMLGTRHPLTSLTTFVTWFAWSSAILATAYGAARRQLPTGFRPGDIASLLFVATTASGFAVAAERSAGGSMRRTNRSRCSAPNRFGTVASASSC